MLLDFCKFLHRIFVLHFPFLRPCILSTLSIQYANISSVLTVSFNGIKQIQQIYQFLHIQFHWSRCYQLNLSERSGKIYTTGKHFSGLPIMTVATILTCDSTYLVCSIRMHCILSWKSSGSNSSVKSICNSITLIGSICMVHTIFP